MNCVAICGSPRPAGNTEILLKKAFTVLGDAGIDCELIRLAERTVKPCTACGQCRKNQDKHCTITGDNFEEVFAKMLVADIIIVGSPVYFGSATPEMMSLLDRAGYVSRANGNLFTRKLGGPIVVGRRAGHNFTFAQLMFWFMINGMVVPGSTYWNVSFGSAIGEVNEDAEGIKTVEDFARNLAWLAEKTSA